MAHTTDLRVIKTKKVLFEALTSLMKEHSFEEIKTSDICSLALVNRSTFYAHYEDKYDLLVDFIKELKNELEQDLAKNVNTKEYFMEALNLITDHIDEKKDIYTAILMNNQNGILMDILLDVASKDVSEKIKKSPNIIDDKIPTDIITRFYLGAIVSVGIEWLRNRYTKDQVIEYLNILIPDKIN